jgi:hypothetical protein
MIFPPDSPEAAAQPKRAFELYEPGRGRLAVRHPLISIAKGAGVA